MIASEVVVLCGGFGSRLRSVVSDVPKPMAPVAGRPFLEIVLSQFAALGFSRAVLSTGYLAASIADHFGSQFRGLDITCCAESEPLGTGGAARAGAELCKGLNVVVCNGDTFVEYDHHEATTLAQRTQLPVAVAVGVPDTERYGRLDFVDDTRVKFSGRGIAGEGFISAGIYIMPRSFLMSDSRPAPFSMEDFLFDPAHPITVHAVRAKGRFIDIGVPDDFFRAQSMFRDDF